MNSRFEYISSYCRRTVQGIFSRFTKRQKNGLLCGKNIMSVDETISCIKSILLSDQPAMICRFGSVEANAVDKYIQKSLGIISTYDENTKNTMYNNAGFFSAYEENLLDRFGKEMLDSCQYIDILATWNAQEPYIISKYASQAKLSTLKGISPKSAYANQWTLALEGKKVLVIHPFEETIISQYNNRDKVFPNGFLPAFELYTIKAVQTIAGEKDDRFSNWFDALDFMKNEMDKIDYDVAIIGCGAYGFLLAAHAKKMGKKAVHLGGGVQMMFGIMGKRWENKESHAINEYWVRPSEDEKPKNAKAVENGCYW